MTDTTSTGALATTEQSTISIAPLPATFLRRLREHDEDSLGQRPHRIVAEGGEPCRDVLRRARPGEELLLASFSPFSLAGPYREFGPVFVLAVEGGETVQRDRLPADGPDRYLREQFVIRAYSAQESIVDAEMVSPETAPFAIRRFFDLPEVAFLHLRFPTYGCFACRIDRAENNG